MKKIVFILLCLISINTIYSRSIKEGISYGKVHKKLNNLEFHFDRVEKSYWYNIYYPRETTKEDIIFYIHGGGWNKGSIKESEYVADYFNKQGYITVLITYPLSPDNSIYEMEESIKSSYIEVSKKFSRSDIIICGSSAGAHLAAILYFKSLVTNPVQQERVKELILISGVLDFNQNSNGIIKKLIKGITKGDNDIYREYNPLNYLKKNSTPVPITIYYSEPDYTVSYDNSISFGEKANSLGLNVKYEDLGDFTHDESYTEPFFKGLIFPR